MVDKKSGRKEEAHVLGNKRIRGTAMILCLLCIFLAGCGKSASALVVGQLEEKYQEAVMAFREMLDLKPKQTDTHLGEQKDRESGGIRAYFEELLGLDAEDGDSEGEDGTFQKDEAEETGENYEAQWEVWEKSRPNFTVEMENVDGEGAISDYKAIMTVTLEDGTVLKREYDSEEDGCGKDGSVHTGDLTGDGQHEIIVNLRIVGSTFEATLFHVYEIRDGELMELPLEDPASYDSGLYEFNMADSWRGCLRLYGRMEHKGVSYEFLLRWDDGIWVPVRPDVQSADREMGWNCDEVGWWYHNGDGTYPEEEWKWIDGNGDGIAESYWFTHNGYCLMDTETPDGYMVDQNGAWIVDGVVQTRNVGEAGEVTEEQTAVMEELLTAICYQEAVGKRAFEKLASDMSDEDMAGYMSTYHADMRTAPFLDIAEQISNGYQFGRIEFLKRIKDFYGRGIDEASDQKYAKGDKIQFTYADGAPYTKVDITDVSVSDGHLVATGRYDILCNVEELNEWGYLEAVFVPNVDSFIGYTLQSVKGTPGN